MLQIRSQVVIFESDCKLVVDSIRSHRIDISKGGNLVNECKKLLIQSSSCVLEFVKTQANRVAHELARMTPFILDSMFFEHVIPCVENLMTNEMR